MSGTVQASGSTPVTGPTDIGMSPLAVCGLTLLAVGPGLALVAALLVAATGPGGGFVIVFCIIPWLIVLAVLGIKFVLLLVTGGGLNYRRAKAALREGRIGVSYYLRGSDDVIIVDDIRRLICCNGDVFSFSDVKRLNTETGPRQHRLDFVLSSGANPIRSAQLNHEVRLREAFERLGNTLGFN